MKRLLSFALAASLSACATTGQTPVGGGGSVNTTPAPSPSPTLAERLAAAAPAIDKIQARYDWAWPFVETLIPYLPTARAAQLRLADLTVRKALAAARSATTFAAQKAAIEQAKAALAPITVASGDPPTQ